MEQINNITEEINNDINITNKPKKEYKFTGKKILAYEKMKEARKKKIEDMRNRKIENNNLGVRGLALLMKKFHLHQN